MDAAPWTDVRYGTKTTLKHIVGGEVVDSVEKESKRDLEGEFSLSVKVSSTSVSVKCNGSQLGRIARRSDHYGAVALAGGVRSSPSHQAHK